MLSGGIRVPSCMPRDAMNSTRVLCFGCIEMISGNSEGCWGILQIQRLLSCFACLQAISGYPDGCRGMPLTSMLVSCLICFQAISGYPDGHWGMPLIQCLYYVSHALRRYQDTLKLAEGSYKFSVHIVFYMLAGDIRVSWRMPRDAINSTIVLCFTCFEAISGYSEGCRGILQNQRAYWVLHACRRYQGILMDAEGCH